MDARLGWILATIALWIAVRTLVRRRTPLRVRTNWLGTTAAEPRVNRHRLLRYRPKQRGTPATRPDDVIVTAPPHAFAHRGPGPGTWRDLSRDGDDEKLRQRNLPVFQTPDELANWLGLPVNRLAWLAHRCSRGKPRGVGEAHYVATWKPKRSGGLRLIESPKTDLRAVQRKILQEILVKLPTSAAAHGFVKQRSIVTNAQGHVGARVLVKFDLKDFYVTVKPGRIIRLLRGVGYSREAAIWLTRLTTSVTPGNLPMPPGDHYGLWRYRHRHLPQGAPTSPALANLVAFGLDRRLAGLAGSFGAHYTRYADDLTFSGDDEFARSLRTFIQLVEQIIRAEGFQSNRAKRQVLRPHQQLRVAGVVINEKVNISRREFDRLKATLHHCVVHGPSAQSTENGVDLAAHLAGRIAHVAQLNATRGEKLRRLFARIDWKR